MLRHSAFLVVPGHVVMPEWREMTVANGRMKVPAEVGHQGLRGSFQAPTISSRVVSCKPHCPLDKSWETRTKELKPKKL